MPPSVLYALAAANFLTFCLFGWDKLCARRDARRVSEATLLWWLFLGSPVGAWLGMRLFRHKTAKSSFRWRAILLSILNPLWLVLAFHCSRP